MIHCVIEVSDNGCGLVDPKRQLSCFCSDKTPLDLANYTGDNDGAVPRKSFAAGRFGVGLSAVILYSQRKTGTSTRYNSEFNALMNVFILLILIYYSAYVGSFVCSFFLSFIG